MYLPAGGHAEISEMQAPRLSHGYLPHGFSAVGHGNTRVCSCHHRSALLSPTRASQRSLHNAPIFRLLLKVAVNGTHQCDFLNFCGGFGSQHSWQRLAKSIVYQAQKRIVVVRHGHCHCLCILLLLEQKLPRYLVILAEGAIALSVTLSGGALFAS